MPEGSRLEFLRSSVGLVAAAAAGATLMPQAGNAEVFTDDVLGFKFEVGPRNFLLRVIRR